MREVKEFNMKLGNTMQEEWEMMRDENLREEQREKETQQATRAFWCDRDNRIERERVAEIDLTTDGMEIETIDGILV